MILRVKKYIYMHYIHTYIYTYIHTYNFILKYYSLNETNTSIVGLVARGGEHGD